MSDNKVEVVLSWDGEGHNVAVAGQWNNWQPQALSRETEGDSSSLILRLSLPPGKHQYKWVVDGVWTVNRDLPLVDSTTVGLVIGSEQVFDDSGNENNELHVEEMEVESQDGDSDSWEKLSLTEGEIISSSNIMTSSLTERISVVERIFSMDYDKTMEALKSCGAELLSETVSSYVYWDTQEFTLLRKGVWLRRRNEGDEIEWQVRHLQNQVLSVVKGETEVIARLRQELGQESLGNGMDGIVSDGNFRKIVALEGGTSKWRVGSTEVEVRREEEVDTALVRVVGDILSALLEMQTSADRLLLQPLHSQKVTGSAA